MLTIFVHENGQLQYNTKAHLLDSFQWEIIRPFLERSYGPIVARWTIKLKPNEVL